MYRYAVFLSASVFVFGGVAYAQSVTTIPVTQPAGGVQGPQQATAPAVCETACSRSNAGRCAAGDVTANPNGDPQCAASRIGIPTYTKLSSFGSAGGCIDREDNNRCASGSCTSWQGKPVYGVAHRTFPFGTTMEVCNSNSKVCQIATVVERGPHSRIGSVTVDARAELMKALLGGCNTTVPATYKVLSVPGISQTAQPSGPAQASLDALLAAGRISGTLGPGNTNPTGYTPVATPYGTGYFGQPTNYPSASGGGSGRGTGGGSYTTATPAPAATPYAASYTSPTQQISASTAAQNTLTAAIAQPSPSASRVVPGAPAVASLYLQSHAVSHGGSFLVSWATLNMNQGNPCTLLVSGTPISKGNQGSQFIPASSFAIGFAQVRLSCTSAASSSPVILTDTISITP